MMRATFFMFWMLVPIMSMAQKAVSTGWRFSEEQESFVAVNAGLNLTSAQFSNAALSAFTRKPSVDKAVMENQLSRLKQSDNRIGGDYELGIKASIKQPGRSYSWLLKAADAGHGDVSVSKTAVELAWRGNKSFAGDTLQLAPLHFNYQRFQQIGLGMAFHPDDFTQYSVLLSYINGEQMATAQLESVWLYTAQLGDTLSASVVGQFTMSDTANKGFAKANGSGASIDFGYYKSFGSDGSWSFNANVFNLGLVQWTKQTINVLADSAIEFTGIVLGDVKTLNERLTGSSLEDSLQGGFLTAVSKGTYNQWLPGWAQFELMQQKDKGFEFGGGFVCRWKSNYKPFSFITGGWRFNEVVAVHADLGYGGYGKAQAAISCSVNTTHVIGSLRISNAEAFIFPTKHLGASAMASLIYRF